MDSGDRERFESLRDIVANGLSFPGACSFVHLCNLPCVAATCQAWGTEFGWMEEPIPKDSFSSSWLPGEASSARTCLWERLRGEY